MKKVGLLICIFMMFIVVGCTHRNEVDNDGKLIYEEVLSPNEDYIEDKKEIVKYNIKIYQNENYQIRVYASSNTVYFEDQMYQMPYDQSITEDDIKIQWTTFMGSEKASEEDQIIIAKIKITDGKNVISEIKVNFLKSAIEEIVNILNK